MNDAARGQGPVLVTGGAGFIGANVVAAFAAQGRPVRLLDNLSRPGAERNLAWLSREHGGRFELTTGDVRDPQAVRLAVAGVQAIVHLAAQVAVTTSLTDPTTDFEVNARGTLNLLEAARRQSPRPAFVYTSTNKVYGALGGVALAEGNRRWEPRDEALRARGVSERTPLELCSPYGCSKGAAEQYALDFARSFGLPAVVLRMSCIYGPRQHGTEDQGWVAHFARRALAGQPVTIYGDGKQVRDLLYVDDLVAAIATAVARLSGPNAADVVGRPFNIGGGPTNAASLVELLDHLGELRGAPIGTRRGGWRTGDQRWYVSDVSAFRAATGWQPAVGVREGLTRMIAWLREERHDG